MLITAGIDFVHISRRIRRREQNRIVRIGKSDAGETNDKRLRSACYTAEANYRQIQLGVLSATAELLVISSVITI